MVLLHGEGSRLYRWEMSRPGTRYYALNADSPEPVTPPRFLIADLPEDLRAKAAEFGESWGPNPVRDLLEAGVDELKWRQPLCHLEDDLVSEDVLEALVDVFGDAVGSAFTISLRFGTVRRRYHALTWGPGWPAAPGDSFLELAKTAELVVRTACRPPLDRGYEKVATELGDTQGPIELAFPSWLDRDDRVIRLNRAVVTEGLLARWQATPISTHLRHDNSEHDLWFTESAGGFDLHGRDISFRWVDAPVPSWVADTVLDGPV